MLAPRPMAKWRCFETRQALAGAAAEALASAIRAGIETNGRAAVALAGGSTPGPVYDRLAEIDLDWARVTVTLTDERWVSADSPLANAGLIRRRLMAGRAASANFAPLMAEAGSLQGAAREAEERLRPLLPFAAVLLGMGEDGHIASMFPGAAELADGLDPHGPRLCLPVPMSRQPPFTPRLTLTLAALAATENLLFLITSSAKRDLVELAEEGDAPSLPIAAALDQRLAAVTVLWAP